MNIAPKDLQPSVPRYLEIYEFLRERIVSGAWPPGYKLPSEMELAAQFDCARMTVGKAVAALVDKGMLSRRRRAGTTVAVPRAQETILEIHDIRAEVIAGGHAYSFERVKRAIKSATKEQAAALGLDAGASVLLVQGLHRADGNPHAWEDRVINLAVIPEARDEQFRTLPPGSWLLERVPWTEAEHQISAINPDDEAARYLAIKKSAACLCVERRTWHDERMVTYVKIVYPGPEHRLIARFREKHPKASDAKKP